MTTLAAVSVTFQDSYGHVFPCDIFGLIPDTATMANLQAVTDSVVTRLNGVSDAKPIKARLTLNMNVNGAKTNPVAGSLIDNTGLLSLGVAGSKYTHSIDIPAIGSAELAGDNINTATTEMGLLITDLTTGISNFRPTDEYGNNLLSVRKARRTTRKSSK